MTIKKLDSNGHAFDEVVEIPEAYRMMASDVSKSVREMVKLLCKLWYFSPICVAL